MRTTSTQFPRVDADFIHRARNRSAQREKMQRRSSQNVLELHQVRVSQKWNGAKRVSNRFCTARASRTIPAPTLTPFSGEKCLYFVLLNTFFDQCFPYIFSEMEKYLK
jgi:hypothetical protein